MKYTRTRIGLVALMVVVGFTVAMTGVGSVAASGDSTSTSGLTVSLEPADQTVDAGANATYEVVVEGATDGVGAYKGTLALDDSSVASIESFDHEYEPQFDNTDVSDDRVNISAAMGDNIIAGADSVVLGTVTVAGDADGTTAVSLSDVELVDDSDNKYDIGTVSSGTLEVANDVDVALSPADQTVDAGANATYEVVAEGATDGVGAYKGTLALDDSSVASIESFDHEYEPQFDNTDVSDDQVNISAAMGDNIIAGADSIVLGTVTVAGDADGTTGLSLNSPELVDDSDNKYNIGAVSGGTLDVTGDSDTSTGATVEVVHGSDTISAGSQATLDVVVSGAQSGISAYQMDIGLDAESASFVDYELTATGDNGPLDDSTISDDGSTLTLDAALLDATHAAANETVIATVTVDTEGPGAINLSPGAASILDTDNQEYNVTTVDTTVPVVGPPPLVGDTPPRDADGDGLYEDVRGNGDSSVFDVQILFDNMDNPEFQQNAQFFDFAGTDETQVTVFDVQNLFETV